MGFVIGVLKVGHLFGLFMGGGSAFVRAVIGMTVPKAPPEHRATLAAMAKRFKVISHAALGLLIVTGAILATVEGVWSGGSPWFWFKLAAVAVLVFGIVMAGRNGARAFAGEAGAGERAERFGKMNMVALVAILAAAVLAFG